MSEKQNTLPPLNYIQYIHDLRADCAYETDPHKKDLEVLKIMAGDFYESVLETLETFEFSQEKIDLTNMEIARIIGGRIALVQSLLDGIVLAHKKEIRDPSKTIA